MTAQLTMSLPARDARVVLRERLAEITRELADLETSPASQAALEIESAKLRRLLGIFQPDGVKVATAPLGETRARNCPSAPFVNP